MNRPCAFLSLLLVSQCSCLWAETLCDYPPQTSLYGIFSNEPLPDCPANQEIAAPFHVAGTKAQLRCITWYGFWWGSPSSSAQVARQITRFHVRLYPDANGSPATNSIFDQVVDIKVQTTGELMKLAKAPGYDGNPVFRYQADLPAPVTLDPAPYWLSVSATHPTTDQWLWCRSSTSEASLLTRSAAKGNTWKKLTAKEQTAFRID